MTLAEKGKQVAATEPVDFEETVDGARLSVGLSAEAVVFEGPDEIQADPSRLQQLLENLFRNSVQHGGDDVTVRVGSLDDEPGFSVADDGPGIPVDEREQVFEYGYTDSHDGTGFGLNIVKTIVDAHGWRVAVRESEDGGARFDVVTRTDVVGADEVPAPPSGN